VRAVRIDNRDELILSVVADEAVVPEVESKLRDRLGVRITVEAVRPGALDAWTEAGTAAKLKRFRDDR
jgi:hypothetical protein